MLTLTVAGLNEVTESLSRESGYRAVAETVAAYGEFLRDGKGRDVAGQKITAKGSAKFGAKGRELFTPTGHPSGGERRRSYTLAVLREAGFVTVGAKGASIPKRDGDASILRFCAPRAFAYWKAQGWIAEAQETA